MDFGLSLSGEDTSPIHYSARRRSLFLFGGAATATTTSIMPLALSDYMKFVSQPSNAAEIYPFTFSTRIEGFEPSKGSTTYSLIPAPSQTSKIERQRERSEMLQDSRLEQCEKIGPGEFEQCFFYGTGTVTTKENGTFLHTRPYSRAGPPTW